MAKVIRSAENSVNGDTDPLLKFGLKSADSVLKNFGYGARKKLK